MLTESVSQPNLMAGDRQRESTSIILENAVENLLNLACIQSVLSNLQVPHVDVRGLGNSQLTDKQMYGIEAPGYKLELKRPVLYTLAQETLPLGLEWLDMSLWPTVDSG